jgi:hypothetical protein
MDNLEIQISGRIHSSNFPVWKNALLNQIGLINLKLITDNDFAAATEDAKLLKKAEKAIIEAKIRAIEQTEEIQLLFDALDEISEQARQARLTLERQIRTRKQEIKDDLISTAITEIRNYIAGKAEVYSQLDNSRYLQRYQYESATKGKASIAGVKNSLASLVRDLKCEIDTECSQVLRNYKLIEAIPVNDRLLFQDITYLVTLPETELRLTIENRTVRVSEQKSRLNAEKAEKALTDIADEELSGTINEETTHYVIAIDLLSTRQYAVSKAREIKQLLESSDTLVGMKLTIKRD